MAYNFYDKEEELRLAEERKRNAENAVNNVGQFNYARQADYNKALDNLLNRKDFKFDVNNDALYKQMKENYANLGKLAMQDTIGKASAMTGGYGNSYAQSVGQQAYNAYMQKAADAIPDLYQMALNRYSLEGDKLAQNLSALSSDRNTSYGEYQDTYNRAANERSYYGNEYNNLYNLAYQAYRDKVSDQQRAAQYALSKGKSGSSSSKGSKSGTKPSTIMQKAQEYKKARDNDGLANYLNGLVADGSITQDEAADYYEKYLYTAPTDILGAKQGTPTYNALLNLLNSKN